MTLGTVMTLTLRLKSHFVITTTRVRVFILTDEFEFGETIPTIVVNGLMVCHDRGQIHSVDMSNTCVLVLPVLTS